MNILIAKGVSKSFSGTEVIKKTDFETHGGKIVGITGENGSGKTVFLKMLVGLINTSSGSVIYNDKTLKEDFDFLPSVGVIIESPGFFDELTGFENLKLLAKIRNKVDDKTIEHWLEKVGLSKDRKKVKAYSLGMKQRLGIAQAFMEDPDVLILDEVTNGLDESAIDSIHEMLRQAKSAGKMIIITSHSKYDIQSLCDVVYVFRNGELLNEKKPADII